MKSNKPLWFPKSWRIVIPAPFGTTPGNQSSTVPRATARPPRSAASPPWRQGPGQAAGAERGVRRHRRALFEIGYARRPDLRVVTIAIEDHNARHAGGDEGIESGLQLWRHAAHERPAVHRSRWRRLCRGWGRGRCSRSNGRRGDRSDDSGTDQRPEHLHPQASRPGRPIATSGHGRTVSLLTGATAKGGAGAGAGVRALPHRRGHRLVRSRSGRAGMDEQLLRLVDHQDGSHRFARFMGRRHAVILPTGVSR